MPYVVSKKANTPRLVGSILYQLINILTLIFLIRLLGN